MKSGQNLNPYMELFEAIRKGAVGKINALLKTGLDINYCSSLHNGHTPLSYAVANRKKIVGFLLQKGADPNKPYGEQKTTLMQACIEGDEEIVKLLLNEQNPITTVKDYICESSKTSPLCAATEKGFTNIVRHLLAAGVNANSPGHSGDSPLHVAAQYGRTEVAQVLCEYGADLEAENENFLETPLLTAVDKNQVEFAKFLLERSANVEPTADDGHKPLSLAVKRNNLDMVTLLLSYGANPNDMQPREKTPLSIYAYKKKKTSIAIELIKYRANINAMDEQGDTLLLTATRKRDVKSVKDFLQRGANLRQTDRDGKSLLEIAIEQNDSRMSSMICKYIAEFDCEYHYDLEALLILAVRHQEQDIMTSILAYDHARQNTTQDTKNRILQRIARIGTFNHFATIYCCFNSIFHLEKNIMQVTVAYIQYLLDQGIDYQIIMNTLPDAVLANHKLDIASAFSDINRDDFAGWLLTPPSHKDRGKHFKIPKKRTTLRSAEELINHRLLFAAKRGNSRLAESAIAMQADLASTNEYGDTALHIAAKASDVALVSLLLSNGAIVDTLNPVSESPVYLAARNGSLTIVQLLVDKHHAKINNTCFETKESLITAAENLHGHVTQHLKHHPAEKGYHLSPEQIARVMGKSDCAEFLSAHAARSNESLNVSKLSLFLSTDKLHFDEPLPAQDENEASLASNCNCK